ncbi:MAG: alanyl-tRNA editing protein [Candidatus Saccharicenans sp.]
MKEDKKNYEPTEKLYFQDAYLKEFTAKVIGREIVDDHPVVILDRTAFYPESGGQPHDLGWLNDLRVIRVEESGEVIYHFLEKELPANEVQGRIDWTRRFDHMQQHTGQHILSQAFYEVAKGETLSFHLGPQESTVEIGLPAVSDKVLTEVEQLANQIVFSNLEVKTYFVPEEKISAVPLRKPPKKSGLIRVVEVENFDYSACGGTHCQRTGEIGLIKVLKPEKIRGNVRFSFVCGYRALSEFENRRRLIQELARIFSAEESEVASCADRTLTELKSLKKKQKKIEEKLSFYEAREMVEKSPSKIISGIFPEKSPEEIKYLGLNLIHQGEILAALVSFRENYFHLILAASDKLKVDVREAIGLLKSEINIKGGGSPTLIELVSEEKDKAEKALKLAEDFLKNKSGLS